MRFLRASTKRSSTQQKGGGARPSRILSMELLRCLSNLRRREREREQRKTTQLTGLKLCNYGWPPQLGCIWLYSCKKAHASIWYTSWTLPTKTIPQHTFELNYWNRNPRVRSLSKFNIPRPFGVLQALCHYAPKQANFWVPAVGFWTVIAWWWHVFFSQLFPFAIHLGRWSQPALRDWHYHYPEVAHAMTYLIRPGAFVAQRKIDILSTCWPSSFLSAQRTADNCKEQSCQPQCFNAGRNAQCFWAQSVRMQCAVSKRSVHAAHWARLRFQNKSDLSSAFRSHIVKERYCNVRYLSKRRAMAGRCLGGIKLFWLVALNIQHAHLTREQHKKWQEWGCIPWRKPRIHGNATVVDANFAAWCWNHKWL